MNEIEENVEKMIDHLLYDHVYFNDPVMLSALTANKHVVIYNITPTVGSPTRFVSFSSERMVHIGELRITPGTKFKMCYIEDNRSITCFNSSEIILND